MKLVLTKRPKGVKIIEGFPGIGLIGTIASQFIIEHIDAEKIGVIELDDIPAIIAIHQNEIVEPVSIYYSKKYNLVIINAINIGHELGWKIAEVVKQLARQLDCQEIICLEGVGSPLLNEKPKVYYVSTDKKKTRILDKISQTLREGVIVGVTGALLAREREIPLTAFFAETHTNLPDSKAAAELIKVLDQYCGFDIDPGPLLKQAEEFENKFKKIFEESAKSGKLQKEKSLSYVG